MAPPTKVRARVRSRTLYEEAVEGFYDAFNHPHELIVHRCPNHASRHKVANGCRSVAKTEWKRYRGAPYVAFQREGSSSRRPCYVIGVGNGEVMLVLPRLLGSQGDTELALKPLVVEADGGERLDGGVSQCQLSSHRDDEVLVPKAHMCARDPADDVTSHPWPDVNVGTCKAPYLVHQLSVF